MSLNVLNFLLCVPLILILFWLAAHLLLFCTSRLFLYQWWRVPQYGKVPVEAEVLSFLKSSRRLYAWYFTPKIPQPQKWVVFFHGNYTTIDRQMDAVNGYLQLGYQVLLPEYHGFRHLKGWPNRKKIRDDLLELIRHVANQKKLSLSDCVFHCFSLGGLIGPDLISDITPASVIVEASVPSPKEFMKAFGISHRILIDRYDNLPLLQKFPGKVLVISYLKDAIIPPRFMRAFRDQLPEAKFVEWNQEHNSIRQSNEADRYWQAIREFLG